MPVGSSASRMSGRLTTARRLLAKRLAGRGVTLAGGALAATLSQGAATASVPRALVAATVKAVTVAGSGPTAAGVISAKVLSITEGVLKTMFLKKLKFVTGALVVSSLLFAGLITKMSGPALAARATARSPKVPRRREALG